MEPCVSNSNYRIPCIDVHALWADKWLNRLKQAIVGRGREAGPCNPSETEFGYVIW